MRRVIDRRFLDQPGFDTLFEAWSNVFQQDNGTYQLDPVAALALVGDARQRVEVEESLPEGDIIALDHVACRYAREINARVDEIKHERP